MDTPEHCIRTASGILVDLVNPDPATIRLRDIAHHLAHINRFTGACSRPYSVAEHSLLVMEQVPSELQATALLHDAAEAYLGDMASPLKSHPELVGYRRLLVRMELCIADKYGLVYPYPPAIVEADRRMLSTEQAVLMKSTPNPDYPVYSHVRPRFLMWPPRPDKVIAEFLAAATRVL